MIYSFDTDIFIHLRRFYNRGDHPKIWAVIEEKIELGEIVVSKEVVVELENGLDELGQWIKQYPTAIIDALEGVQDALRDLTNAYPDWINHHQNNNTADPYVVSVAKYLNGRVVSNERQNTHIATNPNVIPSQPHAVKIPNICSLENIDCFDILSYFVEIGSF